MKMFMGDTILCEIKEVEVKRTTNQFIIYENGNKDAKDSNSRWYRKSKEDVRNCMINHSLLIIGNCEDTLNYEKEKLEKIKSL